MVKRPPHLKDGPASDEELLTEDDRRQIACMRLRRYCFLGTFEPARIKVEPPRVDDDYTILNKYAKLVDSNRILRILRTAYKSKLFRKDEVTFLYVVYLLGDTSILNKTRVREEFVSLVKTDVELFLFCKYATAVHKLQRRKVFCKTIKKAIIAWYAEKSSKELCDMFRMNRGRNGFTHHALIKICRISDHILGTKYLFQSFSRTCTTLLAEKAKSLPPPPESKILKQKTAVSTKVTVRPSSTAATTTNTASATTTTTEIKTTETISVPPKECDPEEIRTQILAISELRTTVKEDEAIKLVEQYNLGFDHLPNHLMQYPNVLKKVVPTMTCEQLLECFKAPEIKKHFAKGEVLNACRAKFQKKDALKDENIDPIMCLISMDNLNIKDPIKQTNNKKTSRGHIVQFSKILFRNSFNDTKPMNLNIHITINMQELYMKRTLKNTKVTVYKYAAIALAFTFFKVEKICDVFRWSENEYLLQPVDFKKNFHYADAYNETTKVNVIKAKQHLWLPIIEALKHRDTKKYDLFICIVPGATRGNKKHCSEYLAECLGKYRRACENNARFVVVDLCRYRKSMRYAKTKCENILEICGLDIHTVGLIQNFALGNFD